MSGYKTYDPKVEGYGNPRQWRAAFHTRMGKEEAREILSNAGKTAWDILGLSQNATVQQIKSAFRRMSLEWHPDRIAYTGKDSDEATERFKEITAAYTELTE